MYLIEETAVHLGQVHIQLQDDYRSFEMPPPCISFDFFSCALGIDIWRKESTQICNSIYLAITVLYHTLSDGSLKMYASPCFSV